MIYQDVKRYLKRHLQKPSKEYEWSGRDNFLFLNFLQGRYSDEQLSNNASEVRQAFRDFFEPVGNLVVRFKPDTGVVYKVVPYHVAPEASRHLEKLVAIIRSNRRHIEYPYQGRDDQIALKGKIRRSINAEIIETDEAVNKKELIRLAIRRALELEPRDVIVQLKRKYVVKIFQANPYLGSSGTGRSVSQEVSSGDFATARSDELEHHYNELLNDIDLEGFLDNVMATLFAGKLNFHEIDNGYYEKNVLALVRQAIAQELSSYVSHNNDYLQGFAAYILRSNFEAIHERIAIELFELISKKDENAQKFLSYYSGEIYIENGKRYAIPEITTPDGKHWNITSISAIATMWLRSRDKKDRHEVEYQNLMHDFEEVEGKYYAAKQALAECQQKYKMLVKEGKALEEKISELSVSFKQELKGEMNAKTEHELETLLRTDKHELAKLKHALKNAQSDRDAANLKYKGIEAAYGESKEKRQVLEGEIRSLRQNLDINSDAFHAILGSFVRALMQRKKLIDE